MKTSTNKDGATNCVGSTGGSASDAEPEIASLQRRLRLAIAAAEKHHAGDIAACEREAKLLPDKARIDWMEKQYRPRAYEKDGVWGFVAGDGTQLVTGCGKTLRDAIDAAMRGPNNQVSNSGAE